MNFEEFLCENGSIVLGKRSASSGVEDMLSAVHRKYSVNPLNPNELIVGKALVELVPSNDQIEIKSIRSMQVNSGNASKSLEEIISIADKYHINLEVFAKQYSSGLSTKQLEAWYTRKGFVKTPRGTMIRHHNKKEN